jgi:PIN domain nuclease of toxin-antitoxin system
MRIKTAVLMEVEARFGTLPITGQIVCGSIRVPTTYPKDPADRVIGATALVEGIRLLTADSAIRRSKVVRAV